MMYTKSPVFSTSVPSINSAATMAGYALVWRQKKLVVRRAPSRSAIVVPETVPMEWLVERVRKSPVKLVLVDVKLGVAALQFWAEVAHRAGKPIYVNLKPGKSCGLVAQKVSYTLLGKMVRFSVNSLLIIAAYLFRASQQSAAMGESLQFYVNYDGRILKASGLCGLIQRVGLRQQLLVWLNELRGRVSLPAAYFESVEKSNPISTQG
ncbi:hypothetical protein [Alkalinema sp. FACHB-956]|uniref:hypothetical protein n=1 Tax=Alkalinema sp. FACHB-956 TaxID=2692768 RepID=UPI001686F9F2|nr:hypothetical protein [Alkalinema sp. FACHB-956]MBD2329624.1 hypothetical protein [Alkalinema sp. FACHB-956]